jgi:hypothetical protein
MVLVILICLVNTAIGFVLAIHFGHGPPWSDFPHLDRVRQRLRVLLKMDRKL